jgi:glucose/mannose transport system permease protein
MTVRWSRLAPQFALSPAVALTVFAFLGSICWTVYLSFTAGRRFPDYELVGAKQYVRLFEDSAWLISLENVVVFGVGSLASIALGFVLTALIDKETRARRSFARSFSIRLQCP